MPKRKLFNKRLRWPGRFPNGHVSRDTDEDIVINYYRGPGYDRQLLILPQKCARLIAKRINQFIDEGG